jgi:DNA polymerase I
MTASRLFLIDGSNQMYRAYHAIRGLTGPDGKSTNAIYGFVTMLRKLIADHHPEFIAAAFDLAGPTFRSDLYADYKATRSPMPPDLAEQIPFVHQACAALGVPVLTFERYEADDVLGTLAMKAAETGFEVALVTGDKDFFQLVGGRIKVYNPRDEGAWYDAEGVVAKLGVRPEQVIDVLALMGDTIDNIKGVPGIGEKGARDLIAAHGSLEALLANAPTLTQKRYRDALIANADQARQSRELVRLRTDVPIAFDASACRYAGADRTRCFELFTRFGFRSLVMEFAPTAETIAKEYATVDTLEGLEALIEEARDARSVALYVVVDMPVSMRAAIVGIAFAHADRRAHYVPLALAATQPAVQAPPTQSDLLGPTPAAPAPVDPGADVRGLDPSRALAILKSLFEDPGVKKIGHDLKFAQILLARHGIRLRGLETDTMLASYVLDANRSSHRLEDLALEELTYRMSDEEDVRGKGVKAVPFERLPIVTAMTFAGERADLTWRRSTTIASCPSSRC